ncbi:putative mimitin, mitochondrial [Apostichopus japonicus]|uniref:Putative mimitin, mitochondrial n=1 Tax=Stichopus japonicus TaxID=307972 RepID=A0A2G8JDZ5_STIJA|nr:putative mimitin, mitochondrial [Apostichopus japonicus]
MTFAFMLLDLCRNEYFRSIFKASKDVKKLVGTDKLGNKYFEIVSESIKAKPKRSMESSQEHVDYSRDGSCRMGRMWKLYHTMCENVMIPSQSKSPVWLQLSADPNWPVLKHLFQYRILCVPHAWFREKPKRSTDSRRDEKRERQTLIVKKRAVEVERKDKELQQREYDEGLVAGHLQGRRQLAMHLSYLWHRTRQ